MALFLGVVGGLLAVEAAGWIPHWSAWLVARTLMSLPEALDEPTRYRWSEEIEADFGVFVDRPLGGLMFALGLRLRGARRLAAALALSERLAQGSEENTPSSAGSTLHWNVPQIVIAHHLTGPQCAERQAELRRSWDRSDLRVVGTYEEARRITDFYVAKARRHYEEGGS